MRELNVNEIKEVNGGSRLVSAAKFLRDSAIGGMMWDGMKSLGGAIYRNSSHNSLNPMAATNRL